MDNTEINIKEVCQTRLKGCHKDLIDKTTKVCIDLYRNHGVLFYPFQGFRPKAQQTALYAQGRKPLGVTNALRKMAGLGVISAAENRKRVTSVTYSWHCAGTAVDIVEDSNKLKPGIQWSWANLKHFYLIGKYAKKHGLIWGGYWKSFKDYPHLELPMKISLREAAQMNCIYEVWRNVK